MLSENGGADTPPTENNQLQSSHIGILLRHFYFNTLSSYKSTAGCQAIPQLSEASHLYDRDRTTSDTEAWHFL